MVHPNVVAEVFISEGFDFFMWCTFATKTKNMICVYDASLWFVSCDLSALNYGYPDLPHQMTLFEKQTRIHLTFSYLNIFTFCLKKQQEKQPHYGSQGWLIVINYFYIRLDLALDGKPRKVSGWDTLFHKLIKPDKPIKKVQATADRFRKNLTVCECVDLPLWHVHPWVCVNLRLYLLECACHSGVPVTSLHHITMQPWHLWQPSEASNLIKTEINLISDLPDEYDKTCSRLMDLDTYQGPGNHWSWIRGGRDRGGGVRGSKTLGGVSRSCPGEVLAGWAWMTAMAGWRSKAPCKAPSPVCGRRERLILCHSHTHTHKHTYTYIHRNTQTPFHSDFPVFNSAILSPFSSVSHVFL